MRIDPELGRMWASKGHIQGECMSHWDSPYMYVYIPKNASSWTKPNLQDHGWEFYNYKTDQLDKHALVVLRDPVDRWLSGIAECMTLYHPTFDFRDPESVELVFDRVTFDDHTERQVYFLDGLDTSNTTFFWCDESYRQKFSHFMAENYGPNKYDRYEYQHVSENSPERKKFKRIFREAIEKNSKYLDQLRSYFDQDYKLIERVKFYGT